METTIKKIVDYARHVTDPEMIILFGSVAEGRHNVYSDIDLLIVTSDKHNRLHFAKQVEAYAREFGMSSDVLVFTCDEVKAASLKPTSFLGSIVLNGKIIFKKS